MKGNPNGTPRQPQAAATPPQFWRSKGSGPLTAELLALHRRGSVRGWGRADYLAIGAALLAKGRSRAGHRWCRLADLQAGEVVL